MNEELKTLVLTQSAINIIADALNEQMRFWHEHNDEKIEAHVSRNNAKIVCMKTVYDYVTSVK